MTGGGVAAAVAFSAALPASPLPSSSISSALTASSMPPSEKPFLAMMRPIPYKSVARPNRAGIALVETQIHLVNENFGFGLRKSLVGGINDASHRTVYHRF